MSTGKLGSLLANFLVEQGHQVTLLLGESATYHGEQKAQTIEAFSTTEDLQTQLHTLAKSSAHAVFHAAAVNDFGFGKIYERSADGKLTEVKSGKISTRQGELLAQLLPTPKILRELRRWFPEACLVGWKYEVDGDRASVLAAAERQLLECRTDACVANGAAYGLGFGVVTAPGQCAHARDLNALFTALDNLINAAIA
jgi:phosphopantothenoylcysteine decarboxylase/phosphopantothenate--cysteine ligase